MANTVFKLRRSSVAGKVPNTSTLSIGELGLNLTDKILYSSDGSSVFEIGSNNTIIRVTNTAFIANATVNSIAFTNAGITATSGILTWNPDESTLDLGLAGNSAILQLGQETLYRVKNQTGSTITNGTVVMANGTVGASGRIKVAPAVANGSVPSQYIMGIATENITNGSDGYVTHFGKVRGIDTSGWPDGTILYADPANTGGMTATKPAAPNSKTIVALVIHSAVNGTLFVRPTFGSSIADDEKVELTSVANGDMLVYKTANGRFENTKDLTISSITANGSKGVAGQVLTSNGTNLYWSTVSSNGGGGSGTTYGVIPVFQQFTANGSTSSFTVTGGYQANQVSVFLNGVLLRSGTEVDVTSGIAVVLTDTPSNGSLIDVVGASTLYSGGINTIVNQQFTSNGSSNSFSVTNGYLPSTVQVFLNGVKQIPGTDVDVTSGNNVVFAVTPANGYVVDVWGYQTTGIIAGEWTIGNTHLENNRVYIGNSSVNTVINSSSVYINGYAALTNYANGSTGSAGQVLASNGTGVYWTDNLDIATNTTASYTWTNTHTFSNTVTFGNTTANVVANSTVMSIANTTGTANITPTSIFLGNSTVNCVINSTSVYVNGVDYNPTTALAIAVALS